VRCYGCLSKAENILTWDAKCGVAAVLEGAGGGQSGRRRRQPIKHDNPLLRLWTGTDGGSAPRVWRRSSNDVLLGLSRLLASLCSRGSARIAQSRQALHAQLAQQAVCQIDSNVRPLFLE
jgi:hypothetical protein